MISGYRNPIPLNLDREDKIYGIGDAERLAYA